MVVLYAHANTERALDTNSWTITLKKKNRRQRQCVDISLVADTAQRVFVYLCSISFSFLYHPRMIWTSVQERMFGVCLQMTEAFSIT